MFYPWVALPTLPFLDRYLSVVSNGKAEVRSHNPWLLYKPRRFTDLFMSEIQFFWVSCVCECWISLRTSINSASSRPCVPVRYILYVCRFFLWRVLATQTYVNSVNPVVLQSGLRKVLRDSFHSTSELVCLLFQYQSRNFIWPTSQAVPQMGCRQKPAAEQQQCNTASPFLWL